MPAHPLPSPSWGHLRRTTAQQLLLGLGLSTYGGAMALFLLWASQRLWGAGPWWVTLWPVALLTLAGLMAVGILALSSWGLAGASLDRAREAWTLARVRWGPVGAARSLLQHQLTAHPRWALAVLLAVPCARQQQIVGADRLFQRQLCTLQDPDARREALALLATLRPLSSSPTA